ncbi:hypothetical protein EXT48_14755 [Pseudoalteromonas sp. CO348]|uniref:hypothetical protein n=1 Tax=Pseudoalteromonas TaxID=53246 RepID=UPI00102373F9|nr:MULTISPECIES: hypothetical protein [Pseudoalteromonas]MCG7539021.1 hypothetical protein [Pseudoalteromonas sp. OF7H-1]MCG9771541.1 hypothetical protein [Pseudoalteromonas piscicida]RZG03260.1 hypothetical protein EXT48_14755 [Pseudoalteromonas sp. CO348]
MIAVDCVCSSLRTLTIAIGLALFRFVIHQNHLLFTEKDAYYRGTLSGSFAPCRYQHRTIPRLLLAE